MPAASAERSRLVALSALMLFVELALIRWTGSNILYLSYFSNFVLLGSFLGIGIGFLRAKSATSHFAWAPVAIVLLVIFVRIFPVEIDRSGSQLIYFGAVKRTGLPTWITLPFIFLAVATIMALVADGVGRSFSRFEPLEAYRLDIIGSILGITAFSGLSLLRAPPIAWGAIVVVLFVVLIGRSVRPIQVIAMAGTIALLAVESLTAGVSWSPYYKVTVVNNAQDPRVKLVSVNAIPHQTIESSELRRIREPLYFVPYQRLAAPVLDDVLIVGAGNGTDVAIALQNGAKHIDAVEIDPRLQQIGAQLQPDRPYQDPRVSVHIADGRAFLERTDARYDLILFALPDSLTLVAGQSSLRLESYLFTADAMRAARDRLKPRGVFAMYNYYRQRWLVDRLAGTLAKVYGQPPCVDESGVGHFDLLTDALRIDALRCSARWEAPPNAPAPVTDDRPFVYLRTPSIPGVYLLTIGLILAAAVMIVGVAAGGFAGMVSFTDLFFMGAAFLLLETKNVVQFALLFGTTWFVNALVFGGILIAVLAAVEVARHVRLPRPAVLYGALLASVGLAFAVPQRALLSLSYGPRLAAAIALAFLPVFLANLVFAQRFTDVGSSTRAFATNLLGAMVGGTLEYAALVTGYRTLLLVVAALYGIAFVTRPRTA